MNKEQIHAELSEIRSKALEAAQQFEALTLKLNEQGLISDDHIHLLQEELGPFDTTVDRLMEVGEAVGINFNETPFIEENEEIRSIRKVDAHTYFAKTDHDTRGMLYGYSMDYFAAIDDGTLQDFAEEHEFDPKDVIDD